MSFRHFFTIWDDYCVTRACQSVHNVSAEETGGAKNGDSMAYQSQAIDFTDNPCYAPPSDERPPETLIIGLPVLVIWTSCCIVRVRLEEKEAREQQESRTDAATVERRQCLEADIAGPLNGFILRRIWLLQWSALR